MPHRAYHLLLGIAGLFTVAALLVAGADVLRHSRAGACWKQRLVSAGLLLLGALGFGATGCSDRSAEDKPGVAAARTTAPEPAATNPAKPKPAPAQAKAPPPVDAGARAVDAKPPPPLPPDLKDRVIR